MHKTGFEIWPYPRVIEHETLGRNFEAKKDYDVPHLMTSLVC